MSPAAAAAETISPAIGAAASPPYPASSTITATAIFFFAAPNGAKPTNHACDGRPATSAVPVFPAMRHGLLLSVGQCLRARHRACSHRAGRRRAAAGTRRAWLSSPPAPPAHRAERLRLRWQPPRAPCAAASPPRRPDRTRLVAGYREDARSSVKAPRQSRVVRRYRAAPWDRHATRVERNTHCTSAPRPRAYQWCRAHVVSSTSSRTGRAQPRIRTPTRPSGRTEHVNVSHLPRDPDAAPRPPSRA